jgi:hypothetical protein
MPSRRLSPQFLHVRVPATGNHVCLRSRQVWTVLFEKFYPGADLDLFVFGGGGPPCLKPVCVLGLPNHPLFFRFKNILSREYSRKATIHASRFPPPPEPDDHYHRRRGDQ